MFNFVGQQLIIVRKTLKMDFTEQILTLTKLMIKACLKGTSKLMFLLEKYTKSKSKVTDPDF